MTPLHLHLFVSAIIAAIGLVCLVHGPGLTADQLFFAQSGLRGSSM
jgi:hypothetical protein